MLRATAIQQGSCNSQLLMRHWHSEEAQHLLPVVHVYSNFVFDCGSVGNV